MSGEEAADGRGNKEHSPNKERANSSANNTSERKEKGLSGPTRVVDALEHAPDNISATLPDSVRDMVDGTERRQRAESATDSAARASNFELPKEFAKVAQDRAVQAQESSALHQSGKAAEGQESNKGKGDKEQVILHAGTPGHKGGESIEEDISTYGAGNTPARDGSTSQDSNLISRAIYSTEHTVEQWAQKAMSGLRTYFHDAEEAAKRGIHYAEHLYQREEEIVSDVGKPADEAGQKVASVARESMSRAESAIKGLSHQAANAKEATKSGLERAESSIGNIPQRASEMKEAAKSGISQAEETAESALGSVVAWVYDTKEAAKRGIHYTEDVGKGIYSAAEGTVHGVESVAAGLANRAIDVKESVKKGIHYAESVYGDAEAALGRVEDKATKAEEAGKDVLARIAAYVKESAPGDGSDEADVVSGGTQARQAWATAGRHATSHGNQKGSSLTDAVRDSLRRLVSGDLADTEDPTSPPDDITEQLPKDMPGLHVRGSGRKDDEDVHVGSPGRIPSNTADLLNSRNKT
eukprot:jgi/Botrbrau1/19779/Bobra.0124s0029.3